MSSRQKPPRCRRRPIKSRRLSRRAGDGKVLQIVEMISLIQKRKMKMKKKSPVFKAVGS